MGALDGLTVLEVGGIGPLPFAGMMLADMGADVIRVDRVGRVPWQPGEALMRGRRSILLDLKSDDGRDVLLGLAERADVLLEGFRPRVLESLRLAPEQCWEVNPRLVIGRMTGWGQDGPWAEQPGHDVNYIGLAGALHAFGEADRPPVIPLNLVGDYGGGGLLLAYGVMCAVWQARAGGRGQVVDTAMLDGAALLMTKWYGELAAGRWADRRAVNRVDGGSHYYHVYQTADGQYLAAGAIEPQFYREFLDVLGMDADLPQDDRAAWPQLTERIAAVFRTRTRAEWEQAFGGRQACVTPVLSMTEAPQHPQARERGTFITRDGATVPAPAPRLSETPSAPGAVPAAGQHTDDVLAGLGLSGDRIAELRRLAVVG